MQQSRPPSGIVGNAPTTSRLKKPITASSMHQTQSTQRRSTHSLWALDQTPQSAYQATHQQNVDAPVTGQPLALLKSKQRSDTKSISGESNSDERPPRDVEVVVVDDKRGGVSTKVFSSECEALLQSSEYFKTVLAKHSSNPDDKPVRLSVHCDIKIFKYLIRFAQGETTARELNPRELVSVLLSGRFLGMHELVKQCVDQVAVKIAQVALLPIDFACLGGASIKDIAIKCDALELDKVNLSKQNSLTENIFEVKTIRLLKVVDFVMCSICDQAFGKDIAHLLTCRGEQSCLRMDMHGRLTHRHVPISEWSSSDSVQWAKYNDANVESTSKSRSTCTSTSTNTPKARKKETAGSASTSDSASWCDAYWRLLGRSNAIHCALCGEYYTSIDGSSCFYHPSAIVRGNSNDLEDSLHYSCCGTPSVALDIYTDTLVADTSGYNTSSRTGCRARDHVPTAHHSSPHPSLHRFIGAGGGNDIPETLGSGYTNRVNVTVQLPSRYVSDPKISLRRTLGNRTVSIIRHHRLCVEQRVGAQLRRQHRLKLQAGAGDGVVNDIGGEEEGGNIGEGSEFDVDDDSDNSGTSLIDSDDDESLTEDDD